MVANRKHAPHYSQRTKHGRHSAWREPPPWRSFGTDLEAIGRSLTWILRHGANEKGLRIRPDGYAKLDDILHLDWFRQRGVNRNDILKAVRQDEKQRLGVRTPEGCEGLHVRAHQGHTMNSINDDALLQNISDPDELEVLCHGTFYEAWESIKLEGLRTMNRNHIHCVAIDLTSRDNAGAVCSGVRGEFQVVVYINAKRAMEAGIVFLRSENGVVLTRGQRGLLPSNFFVGIYWWSMEHKEWIWENCCIT